MAFSLDSIFTTVTAFPSDKIGITEIPPSEALKPYVRCFWQCDKQEYRHAVRIIPDCCADIIIPSDRSPSVFVGVSDGSFCNSSTGDVFGIRFYAWALKPFLNVRISDTFNVSVPANEVLSGFDKLQSVICECSDIFPKRRVPSGTCSE